MPRPLRRIEAGTIYHVLNRGNGRRMLFSKDADFAAFVKLLGEAVEQFPVDVLAWCLMDNHWHLLLRPRTDSALSAMVGWLSVTHARRHHSRYKSSGGGHLYQGRFKSFPVQADEHFLAVARYIHANPVKAKLAADPADWPWSDCSAAGRRMLPLADWPLARPRNWAGILRRPMDEADERAVETSLTRGRPLGSAGWVTRTASRLGLTPSLRPRGRPPKPDADLSARSRRRRRRQKSDQKSR